jgi:AraC-like DNA-binding protein
LAKERKIREEQAEKEKVDTSRLSYIPEVPEENKTEKEFIDKVKTYIQNHISDTNFDILDLCREIGMSRSLFFAKFKEITGSTPNSMLLDTRMRYAAELLKKQKDMNITEVSEKVGYNNTPYFSACFRKRFGMSPTAYRKTSAEDPGD